MTAKLGLKVLTMTGARDGWRAAGPINYVTRYFYYRNGHPGVGKQCFPGGTRRWTRFVLEADELERKWDSDEVKLFDYAGLHRQKKSCGRRIDLRRGGFAAIGSVSPGSVDLAKIKLPAKAQAMPPLIVEGAGGVFSAAK